MALQHVRTSGIHRNEGEGRMSATSKRAIVTAVIHDHSEAYTWNEANELAEMILNAIGVTEDV
jgi:hypothetical protein